MTLRRSAAPSRLAAAPRSVAAPRSMVGQGFSPAASIAARKACVAVLVLTIAVSLAGGSLRALSGPVRAHTGMVVSQEEHASRIGVDVLRAGGNAVDAAVATAFALAVTHPAAGNIGGGGFIIYRPAAGEPIAYDFREIAPAGASRTMFVSDGTVDVEVQEDSHLSVGVPGTVAGLYLAWKEQGALPWKRLIEPAVGLARDGIVVTDGLAESLENILPLLRRNPAALAQFSKSGEPYRPGETLKQPDLARTLQRIAAEGAPGFYEGETALLIEKDMKAHHGLITRDDLKGYQAKKRTPVRGTYRGYEIISMPPPSSGGTALVEMLNILEGYDLAATGSGSAATVHLTAEAMRRAFADRARYLGDPDFITTIPIDRLTSKAYAAEVRKSIHKDRASKSTPETFEWPYEGVETTHLSVVDAGRNAVALTYTLQESYGSGIVVPGAGFLLNDEMSDFNPVPGMTTEAGRIGTDPNLIVPRKRMLSSMTPTIVTKDGKLFMVTGSPGGRTIINTVLQTILNVVDFGMNVQEAVDAPRVHHQWLPDRIQYEPYGLSPDTVALLKAAGHRVEQRVQTISRRGSVVDELQGAVEAIIYDQKHDRLEGGSDLRRPDGAAVGWDRKD